MLRLPRPQTRDRQHVQKSAHAGGPVGIAYAGQALQEDTLGVDIVGATGSIPVAPTIIYHVTSVI